MPRNLIIVSGASLVNMLAWAAILYGAQSAGWIWLSAWQEISFLVMAFAASFVAVAMAMS